MCRKLTKRFSLLSIVLVTTLPVIAQTNDPKGENSPYSRFGIGELRNGVNPMLRSMGSVSSAYANPFAVNTDNPASYGSLKLTTYEAGGEGGTRTITSGTQQYTTGTATLTHLNVGIPVSKHAGIAFGLRPQSRMFYNLVDTNVIPGFGQGITGSYGNGTINYGFIGAGGKYKGISLGFNFGYMFGTLTNEHTLKAYNDSVNVQNSAFRTLTKIGGIYWKGGAQYETKLSKKLSMRLGGTFTLNQDLNATRNENWLSVSRVGTTTNSSGNLVYITDTSYSQDKQKSTIVLPMSYSFGIQLFDTDKWMAGIDFTGTDWSQFRNFNNAIDSVASSTYRIAVGAEYTPNPKALRKYFQRVTYRLGFYYGNDYVELNNKVLNYYAVTGGVSLPFKRTTDRIHLGLEVGKRGNVTNVIEENFVRFYLGISLNDKWFIKRRYE